MTVRHMVKKLLEHIFNASNDIDRCMSVADDGMQKKVALMFDFAGDHMLYTAKVGLTSMVGA